MLSGRYMEGVGMYRWGREVQRGGSPVAAYMMRHALSRISSTEKGKAQERGSWLGFLPYQAAAASGAL